MEARDWSDMRKRSLAKKRGRPPVARKCKEMDSPIETLEGTSHADTVALVQLNSWTSALQNGRRMYICIGLSHCTSRLYIVTLLI